LVGEEDVRVWYEDVVDLDGVCCGVDLSEGDVFVAEEGGEAGSLGHVEEVVEGEGGGGGGGVVEEEGFEEPERVWGVSDGGVSDGEDGWVLGRFEEGRGVVEKVCHEKEACSSESVGSIAREFMGYGCAFLDWVLGIRGTNCRGYGDDSKTYCGCNVQWEPTPTRISHAHHCYPQSPNFNFNALPLPSRAYGRKVWNSS